MARFDKYLPHKFVESVTDKEISRYNEYWTRLHYDRDHGDRERAALFAIASAQLSYAPNVRAVNALISIDWRHATRLELSRALQEECTGFHKLIADGIYEFAQRTLGDPDFFLIKQGEKLFDYRERIITYSMRMHRAKASFLAEILYPFAYDGICIDRHQARLFGYILEGAASARRALYYLIEDQWRELCRPRRCPPCIMRHIYYDRVQALMTLGERAATAVRRGYIFEQVVNPKFMTSHYWSHTLFHGYQPCQTLVKSLAKIEKGYPAILESGSSSIKMEIEKR